MSPAPTASEGKVKAMVLVGGKGTRLRPLTFSIPKPLLPLGERPILEIIIGQLRAAGIQEVVLATGHHAELIRAYCGDGARFGVNISYAHEDKPLGTAGPLASLKGSLAPDDYVLLMNGDVITELDFRQFIAEARESAADLTVAYTNYTYKSPFGVLSISDGLITDVVEKPANDYAVNAGIYCMRGAVVGLVPGDGFFTAPELIRSVIASGGAVRAHRIEGYWVGLDSFEYFEEALKKLQGIAK
jgi:NDP-mannose synthase